jgi:hypothetical protein
VHTEIWWGNLREGENLEDLGVDGGDFKMDRQETPWMTWTIHGSGYGQMEGSCEHGNEHSVPIKRGENSRLSAELLASQEELCLRE